MSDLWTMGGSPRTEVRGEHGPELEQLAAAPAVVEAAPSVRPLPDPEPPGVPFLFLGEVFHIRPIEDYQWELLVWADMAERGAEVNAITQNAATLRLLRSGLVDGEWERFSKLASEKRAQTVRDLMPVVLRLHTRATNLPTVPPSDFSDGRAATPDSSGGGLSSQVIAREEASGRVDRAQIVAMSVQAQELAGRSAT